MNSADDNCRGPCSMAATRNACATRLRPSKSRFDGRLRLESGQFFAIQVVLRKLMRQPGKQLACCAVIFVAQCGNSQQESRKWGEVVSLLRGETQLLESLRLVSLRAAEMQDPANRGRV